MKIKIILALTLLITFAVTGANAQSVRERNHDQRERVSRDFRHGKISKHDRHRLAKERHHYRRNDVRGRRDGDYSHRGPKHFRHNKRNGNRHDYGYKNNRHRKFD